MRARGWTSPRALLLARRLGHNPEAVEDLVQDAALRR